MNIKQLVDIKVTVNKTSLIYGVICEVGDTDKDLFKKIESRVKNDFEDRLVDEKVSYTVTNRKYE